MGALHTIFKALSVVQCKQQDRHTAVALLYKINGTVGQLQMINGCHMKHSALV